MTEKLVIIGDLHFQDNYVYSPEVCENIIKYLISAPYNTPENTAIFLGDLTESHLNSGMVCDYLIHLFAGLKYKQIIILAGNHDLKKRAGKEVTPFDFLKKDPRVYISLIPGEERTIMNFKCLLLPHFLPTQERPSLNKFYSSLSGEYDFIFGHVTDETATMIPDGQKADLSKLKGIKCLGHIHTRISPNYVGSVSACNIKEIDNNRAIWIFDEYKNKTEKKLPVFLEYANVTYPEEIQRSKSLTQVYTFYGAGESEIREKYGNIYIRRIIQNMDSNLKSNLSNMASISSFKDAKDIGKLISMWKSSLKEEPSEELIKSITYYAF